MAGRLIGDVNGPDTPVWIDEQNVASGSRDVGNDYEVRHGLAF